MQAIIQWASVALVGLIVLYALLDWRFPSAIARFEENVIAILLGLLTFIAFTQVVMRYGFNSGWTGALELQRILFAWLILFGMSYGVRTGSHLGVDALIRPLPRPAFRAMALFGALACAVYAAALLSAFWLNALGAQAKGGAIAYWALNWRTGLGLDELRYPDLMQSVFGVQDRVHRWLAYVILPIGLGLFLFRSIQAIFQIAAGSRELIIAGHEAEDLVEENRGALTDEALAKMDGPTANLSDDGPGMAIVDAGDTLKRGSAGATGRQTRKEARKEARATMEAAKRTGKEASKRKGAAPEPDPAPPPPRWSKRRERRLRGKGRPPGGRDGSDR